jgi:hypothetical protein
MSAISLKNHINHADGTKNAKINTTTVIFPLFVEKCLTNLNINLLEINFKSETKINITYQLPGDIADIVEIFNNSIIDFNEAITTKSVPTSHSDLLTNPIITEQQINVSEGAISTILYAQCNKRSVKNGKLDAEVQFKKDAPQLERKQIGAVEAPKPVLAQTKQTKQTNQTNPEETPNKVAVKRTNIHSDQADMISDHIMATLLERKTPLDFVLLTEAYELKKELKLLQHSLSVAKNKEKVILQTQIDAVTSKLDLILPQYEQLKKEFSKAVFQDVVTVSNVGYTKGLSSVKKL